MWNILWVIDHALCFVYYEGCSLYLFFFLCSYIPYCICMLCSCMFVIAIYHIYLTNFFLRQELAMHAAYLDFKTLEVAKMSLTVG